MSLPGGATHRIIAQLEKLPRLRQVQIAVVSHAPQTSLGETVDRAADRWIRAQDLVLLRSLSIEELGLSGKDLLVEDVQQIVSMLTLKRLKLIEPSVTLAQLGRLRREHPDVEITSVWGHKSWSTISPYSSISVRKTPPAGLKRQIESIKQRRAVAVD